MATSYSSDLLKRAAFQDELVNQVQTTPVEYRNEEWTVIQDYLKRRIAEIDKRHK